MDFLELLAVSEMTTIEFFYSGLTEHTPRNMGKDETLYVASILASYAQTSREEAGPMLTPADLSEVFDNFVLPPARLRDPAILLIAGAQSLLLAGFFRSQMRGRHNVEWYDHLGSMFYSKASVYSRETARRMLFARLSKHFPIWTGTCRNFSRELHENRFLFLPE